jgi:ketosteroid isomerase-like protein
MAALFVWAFLRHDVVTTWGESMSDRAQKEKLIREIYAARVNNDMETISRAFAVDVKYRMVGKPGRTETAIQAESFYQFKPLVEQMMKTFIMSDLNIRNIVIEGERAVVHWQVKIESGKTGDVASTELCDVLEFKDGKIVSFTEFCDTALAGRLLGAA